MAFETVWKVRFDDIDRAGILFYPALFDNIHRGVEDLLEDLGYNYHDMIGEGYGMPTVHVEADYYSPLSYRDRVMLSITPTVNTTSVTFDVTGRIEGEDDLKFEAVEKHAMIDFDKFESVPVPEKLREGLESYA